MGTFFNLANRYCENWREGSETNLTLPLQDAISSMPFANCEESMNYSYLWYVLSSATVIGAVARRIYLLCVVIEWGWRRKPEEADSLRGMLLPAFCLCSQRLLQEFELSWLPPYSVCNITACVTTQNSLLVLLFCISKDGTIHACV